MAMVVKKNTRSQDDIRKSLGMIANGSGNAGGNTVYQQSQAPVRATSGTGAAPAGWYGDYNPTQKPGDVIGFSAPNASRMGGAAVGVLPTAEEYKGISTPGASSAAGFTTSRSASAPQRTGFVRRDFIPGADTEEYYDMMKDLEEDRPGPFESRYEGAIQSILDGIMNRKSFDLQSDQNYQQLYNLYSQQYQNQANRAMRDTMGAMQAATGGYGSTAATAAAGQAYDRTMEGLNDRNLALMQMAYGMYQDENADRYNQLGAVSGLDNTDYARYRDTVGDWQADRAYAANQYQNFFNNDLGQYQFNTQMDWNAYSDDASRDWNEYTWGEEQAYRKERDAKADYDSAFNKALSLAQSGLAIPATYGSQLEDDTLASLNQLAAQVQAQKALAAAGGSGGGGGGRRSSGKSTSDGSTKKSKGKTDLVDVMNLARNTGASQEELDDIYNDMTFEEKSRYNLQFRH